jgi:hypothetical protein
MTNYIRPNAASGADAVTTNDIEAQVWGSDGVTTGTAERHYSSASNQSKQNEAAENVNDEFVNWGNSAANNQAPQITSQFTEPPVVIDVDSRADDVNGTNDATATEFQSSNWLSQRIEASDDNNKPQDINYQNDDDKADDKEQSNDHQDGEDENEDEDDDGEPAAAKNKLNIPILLGAGAAFLGLMSIVVSVVLPDAFKTLGFGEKVAPKEIVAIETNKTGNSAEINLFEKDGKAKVESAKVEAKPDTATTKPAAGDVTTAAAPAAVSAAPAATTTKTEAQLAAEKAEKVAKDKADAQASKELAALALKEQKDKEALEAAQLVEQKKLEAQQKKDEAIAASKERKAARAQRVANASKANASKANTSQANTQSTKRRSEMIAAKQKSKKSESLVVNAATLANSTTKTTSNAAISDAPVSAASTLNAPAYKVTAVYPQSGDFVQAWILDEKTGRTEIVRVSEMTRAGAQVLSIEPKTGFVLTSVGGFDSRGKR